MKRFYDLLFTWGAAVYGIGFFVCLLGSWYWAGAFDIAQLASAACWPAILILYLLGALVQRYF